jgi:hypothetical protein
LVSYHLDDFFLDPPDPEGINPTSKPWLIKRNYLNNKTLGACQRTSPPPKRAPMNLNLLRAFSSHCLDLKKLRDSPAISMHGKDEPLPAIIPSSGTCSSCKGMQSNSLIYSRLENSAFAAGVRLTP